MKAVLDHIGIAVGDLGAALAFYRDALGLEVEASEEVASQRVRAHFIDVGDGRVNRGGGVPAERVRGAGDAGVKLELLEATAADSAIAKYVGKRGPGLHHITLRVDDIAAALAHLKARGTKLVDEQPRPGAEGALVAFIHPSSAHGVLVELKQLREPTIQSEISNLDSEISRHTVGDLEVISVCDASFRLDGGALFGIVPKVLWSSTFPSDDQNRVEIAARQLIVRGVRTMLIDAGFGDKADETFLERFAVNRRRNLDHALADAGVAPEDIDIVLATHLHWDHAGGFTVRDRAGRLRPRFPRARYVVRRGEWEQATRPDERSRGSYTPDDFVPLMDAGVLELVADDQTIMPGVRVRRTGGHTMHHQMVLIESEGRRAAFPADLMPTTAHVAQSWIASIDLFPVETLTAKQAFVKEAIEHRTLIFFDHDPRTPAAYITEHNGRPSVQPL
jgi:methylmalonyl-CoA epimerase